MEKYAELKQIVESMEKDIKKFYTKKVDAAGTRIRKSLRKVKILAQEIRLEVTRMRKE